MSIFCRHKWEKVVETTTQSSYEMIDEAMKSRLTRTAGHLFERKHIVILACEKCGNIYKSVEAIG